MKRTKHLLAFEQLETEMALLNARDQLSILGGNGASTQDIINYMLSNGVSYMGSGGIDDWTSSFGSNGYSSNGYGSNGYGSNGYDSNGYGSNGYLISGYGSSGYGSAYGSNGYGSNGYGSNGYGSNGYGSNGYSSNGYGSSGANISVGSVSVTGVEGDFGMTGYPVLQEGEGINGIWSSNGSYGISLTDNGSYKLGLSLNMVTPQSFSGPYSSANVTVLINGQLVDSFSMQDSRNVYESNIYQTGTVPLIGSLKLPENFHGGVVEVVIHSGIYNDSGAGMYGSSSSKTLYITLPAP